MEDSCPKCGAPRTGADSCPRCGVVFARFDATALDAEVPEDLKALWAHAEAAWDERSRHALFTERAIAAGHAAFAASRYRSRGADDQVSAEQLERITSRLEQAMAQTSLADAERGDHRPRRIAAVSLLAIIILLLIGAFCLALVLR
jgi:uncharacterized Zn finger protein (UPF0148 family)